MFWLSVVALLTVFLPGAILPNPAYCFNLAMETTAACSAPYNKAISSLSKTRGPSSELYQGSPAQRKMCRALRNFQSCLSNGKKRLYGCDNASLAILNTLHNGGSSGHVAKDFLKCSSSGYNNIDMSMFLIIIIPFLLLREQLMYRL